MDKVEKIATASRGLIESEAFKEQHRKEEKAFTRTRKLTFPYSLLP